MSPQELQVQQKRELEKKQEATVPARTFVPTTDIYETEQALTLVVEMPGVDKNKVDVNVEDGVLTMQGHLDFSTSGGNSAEGASHSWVIADQQSASVVGFREVPARVAPLLTLRRPWSASLH